MLISLCIVVIYSIVVTAILVHKCKHAPLAVPFDGKFNFITSTVSHGRGTTIGLLAKYNKHGKRTLKVMEY